MCKNPTESASRGIVNIFAYLLNNVDNLNLVYKSPESEKMKIDLYVDASYNNPDENNKSRSGYALMVDDCLVAWYSKKQILTAQSTEEAEVIAANEGTKTLLWIIQLLDDLNFEYEKPKLYEDNHNAKLWIENRKLSMRTRHFDVKCSRSGGR